LETFFADDGEEIRVHVAGQGPPVVLLHEWASSHRVWEPIGHRLSDRFTVYRWDARGHGFPEGDDHVFHGSHTQGHRRRRSEEPVTVQRMAADLACLLDRFRLERPLVVGHSMGALTLWAYILRHGCGRLGKICILDQSPKLTTDADWTLGIYGDWPAARDDAFLAAMGRDFVQAVVELIAFGLNPAARQRYENHHPGIERIRTYLAMLDREPLIEAWPSLSRTDFRPALARIDVPALLVYGEESNYYPPATGAYVRDAIKGATLVMYEGADHSPHVNQPERFAADLARFAGPQA
jgi:pimeloyl-ACP methyl ester carboxylesterase